MDAWSAAPPISATDPNALRNRRPNKVIPVPQEFRRLSHLAERNTLVNDIKTSTGCTVVPQCDQGRVLQFGIIGAGAGLEKAIRQINEWISNAHVKSKDSSAWAKMPAFDVNKWYYEQVTEMELQHKQIFKGPIHEAAEGEAPLPSIVVHWPEALVNEGVLPRDVFGNKLEALDAIRMQNEVFIALLPAIGETWRIKIAALELINIEAAEAHLQTMIDKVKAESMGSQHDLNMILDDQEGMEVRLEEAEDWWPNRHDRVVPRLLPSGMMEEPGSFRAEFLHHTQLSTIQRSFQLALEAVRHKKGAYDLAIRLGCVAMSSKHIKDEDIGKVYKKEVFQKSIDGPIGLDVKKWLADDTLGFQILGSLCAADNFLEPMKSAGYFGHTPESLQDSRPMFRGTWVFSDPTSAVVPAREPVRHSGRPQPIGQKQPTAENVAPQAGLIVVQVDWTDDEESKYEKLAKRFYRLEHGKSGPTKNMNINLLELGESRGWHFALESLIPVPAKTISPVLTGFADRVEMRPNHDVSSTESFAEWDQTPTIKKYLQTGRLDMIYSFGIKKTYYKVEYTCMWYPGQKLPVWGLAVRHTEWATHLAELERLPVGRKADWGHTVATFLPEDGQTTYSAAKKDEDFGMTNLNLGPNVEAPPRDGIRILMDKLLQLSAIVSSVSDTTGGIAI